MVLGARVGETLTQMGLGHGWCIIKGNVLVNRVSKPISALLYTLHEQLLPTGLHPPNTQTKQAIWIKANPSHGKARDPACRQGLTSPSPLKNTRILAPAIPTQPTETGTAQTQAPREARTFAGRPPKSPGWTEGAGPSRKGYPIRGPPDGEKQTRRARGCAWGCGSGTTPPQRVPCAGGRGRAPFHHVCGPSRAWRPPATTCPQTHGLNSQSWAEGQLNSSLALISRHLTPLNRSTAAEGPLPGRRGPVGSQFLWAVLWAPVCLSSLCLCWSLTGGSTCEQDPDPHLTTQLGTPADFSRLWIRPSLNRLGITARQSLKLSCSHQHKLFRGGDCVLLAALRAAPISNPSPPAWCLCPLKHTNQGLQSSPSLDETSCQPSHPDNSSK